MRFRFAATGYWTPVVVLGKDVFLSVKFIRHAQLHQLIDEAEEEVAEKMPEHPLDPRPLLPKGGRLSPALALPLLFVGSTLWLACGLVKRTWDCILDYFFPLQRDPVAFRTRNSC